MDNPLNSNRPRRSGKHITTRSGRVLKVNRSINERWSAIKEAKSRRKVERMIGLPKSRLKRMAWRLHPKRLTAYWFSRDGGIMALKITGISIVAFFLLTLGVFAFFRKDLPDINDISGDTLGGSISYYDRTGEVLLFQDYNAVKRVPVESKDISQFIKDATVAVEDRDFYEHKGFDLRGIARAAFKDIANQSASQGGSTITQQLVKLTQDWTEERTFTRKAKELILAVELERTYTKDEILKGYLNAAPYGGVDYGVQAAASDYFQKSAKDLTLAESAFLAAIPKSPSIYSPYNAEFFNQAALLARKNYVLDSMVDTRKITKTQAEEAKKVDILAQVKPQQTKYAGIKSPYFVLAAKKEIEKRFTCTTQSGCNKIGGWKVVTTLDMNLQTIAEQQIQKGLAQIKRQGGDVAAFAASDVKTGQMVALVGGVDFANKEYGEINYAQTPLPPGSSFKPYDYISLIEHSNNAGAGSVLYDVQGPLPNYPCTNKARPPAGNCLSNYDHRYPGAETLRYALGGSRNIPAVKAMLTAGVDKTINTATSMGLKSGYKCYRQGVDVNVATATDETECFGSSAIGDGAFLRLDEHVHSYGTIARNGLVIPQTYILRAYNSKSSSKPFYEWKQPKEGDKDVKQAVRAESAYIVGNILQDPNASYFSGSGKIHRYKGWNFGLKTGTTNDSKDGWLMGFSSKYSAGVWVGYHTRQKVMSGFMENMTRPIWNGWMTAAHANEQPAAIPEPKGIQRLPAYVVTTHVGLGSVEPSPSTDLYPSWYKPKAASNQSATLDKVSNKLATDCTPPLAKQDVTGNRNADQFSVDIYHGQGSGQSNTSASDDIHNCGDDRPSITLTVADGTNVCSGTCTLTATVSAGASHPLNSDQRPQFPGTVNFSVNGAAVGNMPVKDPSDTVSVTYTPTSDGPATISAQVINSVLYDATDSVTVTLTASGSGLGFRNPPGIRQDENDDRTFRLSGNGNNRGHWRGRDG